MASRGIGVIAVCQSATERHHLAKIKKFWRAGNLESLSRRIPECIQLREDVEEENDLSVATQRILNSPEDNILVTLGYPETYIRNHFKQYRAPLQVIGRHSKPASPENSVHEQIGASRIPSASLLGDSKSVPSVIFDSDPVLALRKAAIRHWMRQNVRIRLLEEDDLDAYFSLRYRVWRELNYIPEDRICHKSEWEVDFTDRSALPIGGFVFDPVSGSERLVGCGRLVRVLGDEEPHYQKMIAHLVNDKSEQKDEPRLVRNFEYPDALHHPFDILDSFPGFWDYYADLVREGRRKAELSRIIVEPGQRARGVGEVIVDSLVDLAIQKGIQVLFLACVAEHRSFYERSGFSVVPSLACDKFVNVNVPAIAMHRTV